MTDEAPEIAALLERSVLVDAPPARVWELVHDPRLMARWSPTLESTRLANAESPAVGVRFTNKNKDGDLEWVTHGEIVEFEPERRLAFRVVENWAIWSFDLHPVGAGTRLVQQRRTPEGLSDISLELTEAFMGGLPSFQAGLLTAMEATLAKVKAEAERPGPTC